jgi:hypothetical protein
MYPTHGCFGNINKFFLPHQKMDHHSVPWSPLSLGSLLTPRLSSFSISKTSQTKTVYLERLQTDLRTPAGTSRCTVCWRHWSCKSLSRLAEKSLWPRLKQDIETYASTCDLCQKNKPYNQRSKAPNQLLLVPQYPWEAIPMYLIKCLKKPLDSTPS